MSLSQNYEVYFDVEIPLSRSQRGKTSGKGRGEFSARRRRGQKKATLRTDRRATLNLDFISEDFLEGETNFQTKCDDHWESVCCPNCCPGCLECYW